MPSEWGRGNTSQQYEPFIENAKSRIGAPSSLLGHAVLDVNYETVEAMTAPAVRKNPSGHIERYLRTVRPSRRQNVTFNLFEGDLLSSPAMEMARRYPERRVNIYVKRVAPESPEFEHAYVYVNCAISEPQRVNAAVSIDEEQMADWQSAVTAEREVLLLNQGIYVQSNEGSALYAVAFLPRGQNTSKFAAPHSEIIAVGGVGGGSDPLIIKKTTNRFANSTTIANPAPNASIGKSVIAFGDAVLIGFSDKADSSGAAGGTLLSGNRGDNWTIDNNISVPINAVGRFGDFYVAAGGTGVGAAKVFLSLDGVNWTEVVSAALPATHAVLSLAVDEISGRIYFGCEGGVLLRGVMSSGTLQLATVALPGTPGAISAVHIMGPDHIAVGAASGYYAESLDKGTTWTQPTIPGASAVTAIAGDILRSYIAVSATPGNRSILSDLNYVGKSLEFGESVSGTITDIATPFGDPDYAIAVTTTGQTLMWRPYSPDS